MPWEQDAIGRLLGGRCGEAAPAQHPEEDALPHLPGTHGTPRARWQGESRTRRAWPRWHVPPRLPCWSPRREAGAARTLVLGIQPWCHRCHRLPCARPPRALRALRALLLPSSTYLSPSHGHRPPPACRGALAGRASRPAARRWPPPLPDPGPGGAEPVAEPGRGGCPEREAHHHPHEPGAGRRAEPSPGPAGLLPLLRVPPAPAKPSRPLQGAGGGGWSPHQHPRTGCSLPVVGSLELETSPRGPAPAPIPIPLALDLLHHLSVCLSIFRTTQAAGGGQDVGGGLPRPAPIRQEGTVPWDQGGGPVSPKADATPSRALLGVLRLCVGPTATRAEPPSCVYLRACVGRNTCDSLIQPLSQPLGILRGRDAWGSTPVPPSTLCSALGLEPNQVLPGKVLLFVVLCDFFFPQGS